MTTQKSSGNFTFTNYWKRNLQKISNNNKKTNWC